MLQSTRVSSCVSMRSPAAVPRLSASRCCRAVTSVRAQHRTESLPEAASCTTSFASQAAAFALYAALAAPAACLAADATMTEISETVDLAPGAADAAAAAPLLSLSEVALLAAPVALYGIFNLYRNNVNAKIKWSDFLLIIAAVAIVGNLGSIVVLHKRFF